MSTWTDDLNFGYKLSYRVEETSHSVAGNSSKVSYELKIVNDPSHARRASGTWHYDLWVDSHHRHEAKHNYNMGSLLPNDLIIAQGSYTVDHDPDGSKTINVSATFHDIPAYGELGDGSISSRSLKLTTIPRKSTPTWPGDFQIGKSKKITTHRASGSFTHTIKITLGAKSKTFTNVGASKTWTPPASWVSEISGSSATGSIKTTTYSGATSLGSVTQSFTVRKGSVESLPSWSDDFMAGHSKTISTNRSDSSFTHTLDITLGGKSTSLTGVGASKSWTPPLSWLSEVSGTSFSKTGTIKCTTYSGVTTVGSTSQSFTLEVPPFGKRWDGSKWVDAHIRRWDGSKWVHPTIRRRYDGSSWVDIV